VTAAGGAPGKPVASMAGPITVSTDWLATHLADAQGPAPRVVDIRGKVLPPGTKPRYLAKRADYDAAHIPGAVFVDWTRDIVDPDDPVPMQVALPAAFATKMAEIGVGDDTLVVVYDDYDHIFAGRLAWALRYYGHDAVRILDGGWARWVAEAKPVDASIVQPDPPASPFVPRTRPELRRTADDVERALGRPDVLLIDARPPEQYAGTVSAASRSGHIPGAFNVPYARLVDGASGRFLAPEGLARVFQEAGVNVGALPSEVIVYCNGGVSCTVPLNALRLLGRDDVAVYDGSWNEWGDQPGRPIKAGRTP
jgi:thiosulfate/3-mercaptopyruvate sulfurtransferase